MKYLIVDGLRETRMYFKEKIEIIDKNAEFFHCISAEDAVFVTLDNSPDLIISSEILSFRSGFELTRLLNKIGNKIPVIIVANDSTNALDAIKNNVFEYLIQPISDKQLINAIEKAIVYIEKYIRINVERKYKKNVKIRLSTTTGYKLVDLDQLAYCVADGSYSSIHFTDGQVEYSSYYLGKIERLLSDYHFVRINRSVIVNLNMISKINKQKDTCSIEVNKKMIELKISKLNLKKLETEQIL